MVLRKFHRFLAIANKASDLDIIQPAEATVEVKLIQFEGTFDDFMAVNPAMESVCYYCELDYNVQIMETNVIRQGDVLVPDIMRNDVYIICDSGKFVQGKNIEVTVQVRSDMSGLIIPVFFLSN